MRSKEARFGIDADFPTLRGKRSNVRFVVFQKHRDTIVQHVLWRRVLAEEVLRPKEEIFDKRKKLVGRKNRVSLSDHSCVHGFADQPRYWVIMCCCFSEELPGTVKVTDQF